MQSTRVYALIFVAFAMVCFATLAAGGVMYWKFYLTKDEPKAVASAPAPTPPPIAPPVEVEPPVDVAPTPKPRGGGGGGGGGAKPVATPAPRPSATGSVSVTFTGTQIPTKIEIACDGGFQQRQSVSGGTAIVSGVPTSGSCKMFPKGGVVATAKEVHGGGSYNCTIEGTTTSCR